MFQCFRPFKQFSPPPAFFSNRCVKMRNKSNAATSCVRCFGRISCQVGPWFYGTYLDQTGDGKGWKKGASNHNFGGGKVGDDIKYFIKTF